MRLTFFALTTLLLPALTACTGIYSGTSPRLDGVRIFRVGEVYQMRAPVLMLRWDNGEYNFTNQPPFEADAERRNASPFQVSELFFFRVTRNRLEFNVSDGGWIDRPEGVIISGKRTGAKLMLGGIIVATSKTTPDGVKYSEPDLGKLRKVK